MASKRKRLHVSELQAAVDEIISGEELENCSSSEVSSSSSESDDDTNRPPDTGNISWKSLTSKKPHKYRFNETKGVQPNNNFNAESLELDFFECLFDRSLLKNVADQTNKFYKHD